MPIADTVIGSLKTPRPHLGLARTAPVSRPPSPPTALTAEEVADAQAEIDEAVREVVEGRLQIELRRGVLASTGTDTWMPPGQLAPRPALAVVAQQLTPAGTVVARNPLLTGPARGDSPRRTVVPPTRPSTFVAPDLGTLEDVEPADRTVIAATALLPCPAADPVAFTPSRTAPIAVAPMLAPPAPTLPPAVAVAGACAVVLGSYLGDSKVAPRSVELALNESLEIGSKPGALFSGDPYVSRYHAALIPTASGVLLEDFGAANGVFMRVRGSVALRETVAIRVGRQLLEFAKLDRPAPAQQSVKQLGSPDPGYWARVSVVLDAERSAAAIAIRDQQASVGREDSNNALAFRNDDRLDARHCTFSNDDEGPTLHDGGTAHGTWLRLQGGDAIPYGTELLIGDTRVRLERRG